MSHLLAISVGPVQEFIAAARRTRDLWLGSHLLSEISRAVAKAIESEHSRLIFPESSTAGNVANIILAELGAGDPKTVAALARQAAKDCWRKFAEEARSNAPRVIHQDIWQDQVDDVIEFYAAWLPRTGDYQADRRAVMRLLAGRKNCRDFLPAKGRTGVPKSSLDGQRESVLKKPTEWGERDRARLRIREGEQLDVVGLVKRVAGGSQPYPSVARIAADPWVRGNQPQLKAVVSRCEQLDRQVIRCLDTATFPQFAAFPYEGTAVYVSRHHELTEETNVTQEQLRPLQNALRELPEPEPYLAVLVADGDRIGAAISALESPDSHREFSRALAGFAKQAEEIVKEHNGVLVYAGGDDVLAFLPVDRCLNCARRLHDAFGSCLEKYSKPTLSVGIAIGHFMENLEDLLEQGRLAEKAAKQVENKDALAIHLHKRGGGPIRIQGRWEDNPDERWARYAQLIRQEAIPSKLPYDLRKLAEVYENWIDPALALGADVLRVIRDKQPRKGRDYMPEIVRILEPVTTTLALRSFAEELLVARQLAAALRQANAPLEEAE